MQNTFDTIVIGATFYGCGLAASGKNTLVLESTNHVGSDFVFSFYPGSDWEHPPATQDARRFLEQLKDQGILKNGLLHVGGLAPAFAGWCLLQNINVLLLSEAIEIKENEVSVFNPAGQTTYRAERIIDTRPSFTSGKLVTAIVHHAPGEGLPGKHDEFELVPSRFEDESYLLMDIPATATWVDARAKLHSAWRTRPQELSQHKMAIIAPRFSSRQLTNPVAELDRGISEGEQ